MNLDILINIRVCYTGRKNETEADKVKNSFHNGGFFRFIVITLLYNFLVEHTLEGKLYGQFYSGD